MKAIFLNGKKAIFSCCFLLIFVFISVFSVNFLPYINDYYVNKTNANAEKIRPKILIDPGHGGVDGGAVSPIDKTVEKGLNLQIANRCRDLFLIMGYDVTMTRTEDISIHDDSAKTIRQKKVSDLKNRLNMLESGDFELLLSVHMNIFSKGQYHGTQVFFGGKNEQSAKYAKSIQNAVQKHLQTDNDRVEKQSSRSIYILYNATKPAVMAECGFLSNYEELCKLKSDDYQKRLSLCLVGGIIENKYSDN